MDRLVPRMDQLTPRHSSELNQSERIRTGSTPALFSPSQDAAERFWEFFAATVRNPNTREAYLRACFHFADWAESHRLTLKTIKPMHVAAYVEMLSGLRSVATCKLAVAAIRCLFNYLVITQIVPVNPATPVRPPRESVTKGKTPILSQEDMRTLFEGIPKEVISDYRDRAMIAIMAYSFARVGSVCTMKVADFYTQGKRSYFRLNTKAGKYVVIPAHHIAQEYVDEYIDFCGIADQRKMPLFRSTHRLTKPHEADYRRRTTAMTTNAVCLTVKRRCKAVGLPPEISPHSFRGTGITAYLRNGGKLETAALIAGHNSTVTTQLYDHRDEEITLSEMERISF